MEISPKEFGKELKRLRKEKKLTMTQLGEKIDLTQAYLSMLENGKAGKVKPDTIRKLSEGLGISYFTIMNKAGYLIEKEENKSKMFGDYIRELREKSQKTVEEVSEESGLSIEEIQKIENKEEGEPSKAKLLKLGKAMGIDDLYMWFFENTHYHLYSGDIFDLIFHDPSNKVKVAVSLPTYIDVPEGNGVIGTVATKPHHLFDLFYLLNMNVDLHYKDKLLTDSDKNKIKIMLQTIFE
ncbi:helix-turn-helix domain-containing protein [Bacillus thuringiensis]|uniref:helix-turn-helix domain-containing protein n=1 Tax=Bacillus thuringiensis TaxID=1428 RepID=UPI00333C86B6